MTGSSASGRSNVACVPPSCSKSSTASPPNIDFDTRRARIPFFSTACPRKASVSCASTMSVRPRRAGCTVYMTLICKAVLPSGLLFGTAEMASTSPTFRPRYSTSAPTFRPLRLPENAEDRRTCARKLSSSRLSWARRLFG